MIISYPHCSCHYFWFKSVTWDLMFWIFYTSINWKHSNSCPILLLLILQATIAPNRWTFSLQEKPAISCMIWLKRGLPSSHFFSACFEVSETWAKASSQKSPTWVVTGHFHYLKIVVRKRQLCSSGSKMRSEFSNSYTELSSPVSCPWSGQLWM